MDVWQGGRGMTALAITSPEPMDAGLHRSAALMRALGPDAGAIWTELTPEEGRALAAAMDAMANDAGLEAAATQAFVSEAKAAPAARAREVWGRLSGLNTDTLAQLLGREHPQTLAFILSRINGDAAARLLRALPPTTSIEAMQRLLHLGRVHPSATQSLSERLTEMMTTLAPTGAQGGHERVARIFDRLDSRSEKAFLAALENAEPGAGEKVRALMFTFDDLTGLDAAAMQTLLSSADRTVLQIALKGAKDTTSAAFYANMTKRAGDLLREEIDSLGAVRRSEVDASRQELVALARRLIHRGDIRVADGYDEELVE
jgi:flagellar motor switch protein FliG